MAVMEKQMKALIIYCHPRCDSTLARYYGRLNQKIKG
jgi:hypothetical protein